MWGREEFFRDEGLVGRNMDGGWVTSHTVYVVGDIIFWCTSCGKNNREVDRYLWYMHSLGSWGGAVNGGWWMVRVRMAIFHVDLLTATESTENTPCMDLSARKEAVLLPFDC